MDNGSSLTFFHMNDLACASQFGLRHGDVLALMLPEESLVVRTAGFSAAEISKWLACAMADHLGHPFDARAVSTSTRHPIDTLLLVSEPDSDTKLDREFANFAQRFKFKQDRLLVIKAGPDDFASNFAPSTHIQDFYGVSFH